MSYELFLSSPQLSEAAFARFCDAGRDAASAIPGERM